MIFHFALFFSGYNYLLYLIKFVKGFLLPWDTVFYQRYQSAAKIFKVKANYKIKQIASVFPIVFGQTQIPVSQAVNLASFYQREIQKTCE